MAFVDDPGDPRFAGLVALYERSIPERERKSVDWLVSMLSSPRHRLAVASDGTAVTGFFILYVGRDLALLEYLATDEAWRGRGLGSALYRAARAEAAGLPLLVEVESDCGPGSERDVRARRIGFYRRLGCRRILGFDFILPLPGVGNPPPLDLMIDASDMEELDAERFAGWLREVYLGVYGCDPRDPRLARMIGSLPPVLSLA